MPLSARDLTLLHRRRQLALRDATKADVARLWPAFRFEDLDGSYAALAGVLAALVSQRRQTSAGLAAAYLRALRVASGLRGDVRPVLAEALPVEQFSTSLRVTSVVAVKRAMSAGTAADVAMSNALTQTTGSMSKLVLNAGRETVTATTQADPKSRGWTRVLGSGGCGFCRERAGIRITSDVVFDAHDHCGCTAQPNY